MFARLILSVATILIVLAFFYVKNENEKARESDVSKGADVEDDASPLNDKNAAKAKTSSPRPDAEWGLANDCMEKYERFAVGN